MELVAEHARRRLCSKRDISRTTNCGSRTVWRTYTSTTIRATPVRIDWKTLKRALIAQGAARLLTDFEFTTNELGFQWWIKPVALTRRIANKDPYAYPPGAPVPRGAPSSYTTWLHALSRQYLPQFHDDMQSYLTRRISQRNGPSLPLKAFNKPASAERLEWHRRYDPRRARPEGSNKQSRPDNKNIVVVSPSLRFWFCFQSADTIVRFR